MGSSADVELMVEQVTSILSSRLKDLLARRCSSEELQKTAQKRKKAAAKAAKHTKKTAGNSSRHPRKKKTVDEKKESDTLDKIKEYYRRHSALREDIVESLRKYVRHIGSLYHDNPYHSFQHATHVTVSANKLLSMMLSVEDLGCYGDEEEKKKDKPKPAKLEKPSLRRRSTVAGLVASQQQLLHKVDGLAKGMKNLNT
eukprot:7170967-Ditylum_brightwellii.AAC.1